MRSVHQAGTLRRVFREYARAVGPHFRWEGFAEELQTLPRPYVPPRGSLLVAWSDRRVVGMVGLRPYSRKTCEMKRLYVRPAFRGQKIGERLVAGILDEARRLGYRRMRLDTLHFMKAAQGIYRKMGFRRVPPYLPSPGERAYYFEVRL